MLHWFWQRGELGIDFTQTLLPAAETIADGDSPYPAYGYPPLVAFALLPFVFVPAPELVYTGVLALMLPASLWILRVRDWRCYGAAFLWGASFHAIQTGNVSLVLLLLTAITWRTRRLVGRGGCLGRARHRDEAHLLAASRLVRCIATMADGSGGRRHRRSSSPRFSGDCWDSRD